MSLITRCVVKHLILYICVFGISFLTAFFIVLNYQLNIENILIMALITGLTTLIIILALNFFLPTGGQGQPLCIGFDYNLLGI